MNNIDAEQRRLKEITHISNIVRQKYKTLKDVTSANENALEELFKPVVTPLKQLVEVSKHEDTGKHPIKVEPVKNEVLKKDEQGDMQTDDDDDKVTDDADEIQPEITDDDEDDVDMESTSVEKSLYNKTFNEVEVSTLLNQYLKQIKKKNNKHFDYTCGVRNLQNGYFIGDKSFDYQNGYILIGNKNKLKATPGLLELIFKAKPDKTKYTNSDITSYKAILTRTSAHKKHYFKNGEYRFKDPKVNNFIAGLFKIKKGKGLPKNMVAKYPKKSVDYIHYDDVNELVERLQLLMASQAAGNDSHSNEIISIIEELREQKIIY